MRRPIHGGQLEDVQERPPRPAAFFEKFRPLVAHIHALRHRDLPAVRESCRRPSKRRADTRIEIGAQNLSWAKEGAFTGEFPARC